jgi:hypothetical protein
MTMQFAFMSLRYAAPVSDRLAVNPRARWEIQELEDERRVQHEDIVTAEFYMRRTYALYHLGLMSFLVGLVLMLWREHWTAGSRIAILAASFAAVIEFFWGARPHEWNLSRPMKLLRELLRQTLRTGWAWLRDPRVRVRTVLVFLYDRLLPRRIDIGQQISSPLEATDACGLVRLRCIWEPKAALTTCVRLTGYGGYATLCEVHEYTRWVISNDRFAPAAIHCRPWIGYVIGMKLLGAVLAIGIGLAFAPTPSQAAGDIFTVTITKPNGSPMANGALAITSFLRGIQRALIPS